MSALDAYAARSNRQLNRYLIGSAGLVAAGAVHSKLKKGHTKQAYASFSDELEKIASFIHPAADLAGLTILGVPSAQHLMEKKKGTEEDKKKRRAAKYELAGLGTLAGATIAKDHKEISEGLKHGWGAVRGAISKVAGKRKLAMMNIGKVTVPNFLKGRPRVGFGEVARGTPTMATPPTPSTGASWRTNKDAIPLQTAKRHGGAVQPGAAHGVPATPAPAPRKWGERPRNWQENPNAIAL
jgi:hypothetical protein